MGISKFLKTLAVCTGAVVEKVCKFYIFFYIFGFIKKKNLMSVVIL